MDGRGISPSEGRKLIVVQPGEKDHLDTVNGIELVISRIRERLHKTSSADALWHDTVDSLQAEKGARSSFFNSRSEFGCVWAASGFRRSPENARLDWAVVEPSESRLGSNKVCT